MAITIGIAGITGKLGRCLQIPLLFPPIPIPICPNPNNPRLPSPFDPSTIRSFVTNCDVIVCCYLSYHLPSDSELLMVDGQKMLIDACEAAHVPRYVAGDWALDYTKLQFGQLVPMDAMKRVKDYLDEKGKKGGKVKGVVLDPDATGVLRFVSGRATIREIAASFGKVYGIKLYLERLGSLDDLYKHMHQLRAENPADISKYIPLYPDVKPVDWESHMARWPLEQLTAAVATVGSQL
ncbi:hypothetical protein VTN00DRAFT_1128 [Thermoascus crustaceus]|uniref:uncharacterized protein n=1 Tax=Thermoascus crustaceus TaxID=5088 RepID=UPI00374362A5